MAVPHYLLKSICLAILFITLVAGLWPFNFFPKNKVAWLPDRDGVHFYGQGMIIGSDLNQERQKSLFDSKSITLEFRLRPALEPGNAPNILTLYDGKILDIFAVRQWRSHMVIWSRADDPAARKRGRPYQEMGFRGVLVKDKDVFLTVVSGTKGSAFYLNGQLGKTYPRHRLLAADASGNARLILGNSPTGESCWTGEIGGLAIYNRTLTPDEVFRHYQAWLRQDSFAIKQEPGLIGLYPFYERNGGMIHNVVSPDETLTIPEIFKPVRRKLLAPPWPGFRLNWSFVQDVTVNLLGFIPAGFFFTALLLRGTRQKSPTVYVITAIFSTGLSLFIELTQAWLPTRDSSLTDVACNAAGTIIGIAIYQLIRDRAPIV